MEVAKLGGHHAGEASPVASPTFHFFFLLDHHSNGDTLDIEDQSVLETSGQLKHIGDIPEYFIDQYSFL
jgi:hypothetical protein